MAGSGALSWSRNLSAAMYERFFVYALCWSVGGLYEQEEREKFHKFLDQPKAPLPAIF